MKALLVRQLGVISPLWLIVILATLIGSMGGLSADRAVAQGLITLIIVVGLGVFVSNSGVLSFGHMAFVATGAYSTAIVTMSAAQKAIQLDSLPQPIAELSLSNTGAIALAVLLSAVFALVIAVPLMRLSGLTAALATFAVLIVTRVVLQNLNSFTRGTKGLILDSTPPGIFLPLTAALAAIALAVVFAHSQVGIRLVASREDEAAARSIGIRVWWERGIAWILSAAIVAAGGALFAIQFRSMTPDSFYINYTFIVVAMLVVGGINTVSGAVIGTAILTVAVELLRFVEGGPTLGPFVIPSRPGLSELGLAVILLATLILRPNGIVGNRELTLGRLWHRKFQDRSVIEVEPTENKKDS